MIYKALRHPLLRLIAHLRVGDVWLILTAAVVLIAMYGHWIWTVAVILLSNILILNRRTFENSRTLARTRLAVLDQKIYNERATIVLKDLRKHAAIDIASRVTKATPKISRLPIVLFIRPFAIDKVIFLRDRSSRDGYTEVTMEEKLSEGYNERSTTVTFRNGVWENHLWHDALDYVGRNTERSQLSFYNGPGEIRSDDSTWFQDFALMAEAANLIVSIPIDFTFSRRPSSTIAELKHLQDAGLLRKSIFVVPPEQTISSVRVREHHKEQHKAANVVIDVGRSTSQLWEETRVNLAALGMTLPEYRDSSGDDLLIFRHGANGLIWTKVHNNELRLPRLYLDRLMSNLI